MAGANGLPLMLGLDLGTTGARAGVIDSSGRVLSAAFGEYCTSTPRPGWAEQEPADWWAASAAAVRSAIGESGARASGIRGVGVSGQMHGSVLLDSDLEPVAPCIIWCDQRASAQCERITREVGDDTLAELVGNRARPGFTAPKIMWMREHEPATFARVSHIMLPKDYINLKLTGSLGTDASDASGTLLFDIRERAWSAGMLDRLQIELEWLPDVLESPERLGSVTAQAASITGLEAGTPVAAGGADNACSAIGMGVISEGLLAVSTGSSGTMLAPTGSPRVDERMLLHSFCHAVPGTWYLMGVMLSAGLSLRWFRDELGEPEAGEAARAGRDPYQLLDQTASQAPPGCEGLVFLPYLSGERTPHPDPDARGVLFGIDLTKKRAHVVRAVMEGVVFGLADSVSLMREAAVEMDSVVSGGGGSRSALWRRMQADIFGMPVAAAGEPESAMLGAALLGGVAGGVFGDVAEACASAVHNSAPIEPDPSVGDAYAASYETFRRLYPALRPVWSREEKPGR